MLNVERQILDETESNAAEKCPDENSCLIRQTEASPTKETPPALAQLPGHISTYIL